MVGEKEMYKDKSENKSLTSVDRSNKATLHLTILRSAQVVYKGFFHAIFDFSINRLTTTASGIRSPYNMILAENKSQLFVLI